MPIECPHCRMVTANERAARCIACGRKFVRLERKVKLSSWWNFLPASVVLAIAVVIFVRHC